MKGSSGNNPTPAASVYDRAIRGDREALTALLEQDGPVVRARIAARIPARWQSLISEDDVLQQTYADAFRSIGRFVPLGEGAFRAWLTSLADCNLRDAVKMLGAEKRGGARRKIEPVVTGNSFHHLFDVLSSSGTSPTKQFAKGELEDAVRRGIESLPETYRTVVQMYDLEGRSAKEVAITLGRSPGAVYMLRARAHDRLRETLTPETSFFTDSP